MQFEDLKLVEPLLKAVRHEGYTLPTPIQQQAIPHVLLGRDLLGCAQTGTGKTAAFALPILQRLAAAPANGNGHGHPHIRALILSPTRELATQIGESFRAYGRHMGLKHATIYGGVGQNPQVERLKHGVDILVATPGRLLDLMQQGFVRLDRVETFVLDEGDRMLDMGFIDDVRKVVKVLPHRRQTLLFSATIPADIKKLADSILTNPVSVSVTPSATTVELTEQRVYFVAKNNKIVLLQHLLADSAMTRVLIFTRTKHGANKVVRQLAQAHIQAEPIHSNKSQAAREKALSNFKSGRTRVLVATDIAARGIDVDNISHVINYDLPNEPETYVHRIGRTGRAGAVGIALSFCSGEERPFLVAIERLIRQRIAVAGADLPASVLNGSVPASAKPQMSNHRPASPARSSRPARNDRDRRRRNRPNGNGHKPPADTSSHPAAGHAHVHRSPGPVASSAKRRQPRLSR